jgi:hypothetical protein
VIDRIGDSTRLIELGGPMPICEFHRYTDMWAEPTIKLAVPVIGLLTENEIRIVLRVTRCIKRAAVNSVHPIDQGAPGGRCQKSELRAKSRDLAAIFAVVNVVPDLPLVMGAMIWIVGMGVIPVQTR